MRVTLPGGPTGVPKQITLSSFGHPNEYLRPSLLLDGIPIVARGTTDSAALSSAEHWPLA
jgi:hypothetical protein